MSLGLNNTFFDVMLQAAAESELERRRVAAITQQNSSTQEQLAALQRRNSQLQTAVQALSSCRSILKQYAGMHGDFCSFLIIMCRNLVSLRRSLSQQKEKVFF